MDDSVGASSGGRGLGTGCGGTVIKAEVLSTVSEVGTLAASISVD